MASAADIRHMSHFCAQVSGMIRAGRTPSDREWEMFTRQFTADEALMFSEELIESAKRKEAAAS